MITAITTLTAKATYARSLYVATVSTLGPRQAYQRACELAGLSAIERASLRASLSA